MFNLIMECEDYTVSLRAAEVVSVKPTTVSIPTKLQKCLMKPQEPQLSEHT
jgi:hypothetical protein